MNVHGNLVLVLAILGLAALTGTVAGKECHSPCGSNAHCNTTQEYPGCECNPGFYGSGYSGCTATPQCTADGDCADHEVCNSYNLCSSACTAQCPQDVGCEVAKHKAKCIYTAGPFNRPPPPPPPRGDHK